MARYCFDLIDEGEIAKDEEGLELPNLHAVQAEAAKSLADMARDAIHGQTGPTKRRMAIDVRDDSGAVMQVKFSFEVERSRVSGVTHKCRRAGGTQDSWMPRGFPVRADKSGLRHRGSAAA